MKDVLAAIRAEEALHASWRPPARSSYRLDGALRVLLRVIVGLWGFIVLLLAMRGRIAFLLLPVALPLLFHAPRVEIDGDTLVLHRPWRRSRRFPLTALRFTAEPLGVRLAPGLGLTFRAMEPASLYSDLLRRGVRWPEQDDFVPPRDTRVALLAAAAVWLLAVLAVVVLLVHPAVPALFAPAGVGLLAILLLVAIVAAWPFAVALTGRVRLLADHAEVTSMGRTVALAYRELRLVKGLFTFSLVTPTAAVPIVPAALGEQLTSSLYRRWSRSAGSPYR